VIIGKRKPLEAILEMIGGFARVLDVGCGGCTSICLAGGQREVSLLGDEIRRHFADAGRADAVLLHEHTIERQCNATFFRDLDAMVKDYDAVLSMACGAGVQFLADRYPEVPVVPALDTTFVGVDRDVGWYEENCRTCGDCVLGDTGGICPVSRCAKSLFNGPCGGTRREGTCEVDANVPCAWFEIYHRLKKQDRLHLITKVRPTRDWENQTRRSLIQDAYKDRYVKR
jgi:ferredoxin